jgi:hypothetical protein
MNQYPGRDLVNLLLLDAVETEVYLGGIRLFWCC